MAVSVEYAVEQAMDLSHRLRYDGNNLATGWKAENQYFDSWHKQTESYLLQSVQIGSMAHLAASQGVQEDHSVVLKRPEPHPVVYCPV